jgi:hypothetical protein
MPKWFAIGKRPVSIKELNTSSILIYPNPASDNIEMNIEYFNPMLKRGVEDQEEIKIYNEIGECVMTTPSLRDTPSEKGNIRIDI